MVKQRVHSLQRDIQLQFSNTRNKKEALSSARILPTGHLRRAFIELQTDALEECRDQREEWTLGSFRFGTSQLHLVNVSIL